MTYTPNRFNKGSGTYKCQCCGKLTRETGDGESDYELCAKCNFEGLMENSISDGNQKCTCGNTDDFTINYRDHDLTCNKCGARGAYESWAQPVEQAEKVKLTEEERKAKKQERRRARRAAKKAASTTE